MNDAQDRQQRIHEKIAQSQQRLERDDQGKGALPSPARFPDAYPPEDYTSLAREYPWLAMAAGLGGGLLLGALLPKGLGGKLGKRALTIAAVAGELGLALSKQAGEKAVEAGRDELANAAEGATKVRGRVTRLTDSARARTRSTGLNLAREAIRLAARVRK